VNVAMNLKALILENSTNDDKIVGNKKKN